MQLASGGFELEKNEIVTGVLNYPDDDDDVMIDDVMIENQNLDIAKPVSKPPMMLKKT